MKVHNIPPPSPTFMLGQLEEEASVGQQVAEVDERSQHMGEGIADDNSTLSFGDYAQQFSLS